MLTRSQPSRRRCGATGRRPLVWLLAVVVVLDHALLWILPRGMRLAEASDAAETTALFSREWEVIETYSHDRTSFTQGLEVHPSSVIRGRRVGKTTEGSCGVESSQSSSSESCVSGKAKQEEEEEVLLVTESTGMHGDSLVRIWDLRTGSTVVETKMEGRFFGEGSTRFVDESGHEKIAVLTWREESILVYDAQTLELVNEIKKWPSPTTTREGWGIAFDPVSKIFMVTDGSEYLHFWNTNFEEIRPRVPVRVEELVAIVDGQRRVMIPRKQGPNGNEKLSGTPIKLLNELEWDAATSTVLANRWGEDIVLRIDPRTGIVTRVYDFTALYPHTARRQDTREDVFNGIAVLPHTDGTEWLVTGKYWPSLYRIKIRE